VLIDAGQRPGAKSIDLMRIRSGLRVASWWSPPRYSVFAVDLAAMAGLSDRQSSSELAVDRLGHALGCDDYLPLPASGTHQGHRPEVRLSVRLSKRHLRLSTSPERARREVRFDLENGGGTGIRTPGSLAAPAVFKTASKPSGTHRPAPVNAEYEIKSRSTRLTDSGSLGPILAPLAPEVHQVASRADHHDPAATGTEKPGRPSLARSYRDALSLSFQSWRRLTPYGKADVNPTAPPAA
jgi:hypothetical protein